MVVYGFWGLVLRLLGDSGLGIIMSFYICYLFIVSKVIELVHRIAAPAHVQKECLDFQSRSMNRMQEVDLFVLLSSR